MNLRELIGHRVARTKPISINDKYDYSYINVDHFTPKVETIINNRIVVNGRYGMKVMSMLFDDDNWQNVDDVYEYCYGGDDGK